MCMVFSQVSVDAWSVNWMCSATLCPQIHLLSLPACTLKTMQHMVLKYFYAYLDCLDKFLSALAPFSLFWLPITPLHWGSHDPDWFKPYWVAATFQRNFYSFWKISWKKWASAQLEGGCSHPPLPSILWLHCITNQCVIIGISVFMPVNLLAIDWYLIELTAFKIYILYCI